MTDEQFEKHLNQKVIAPFDEITVELINTYQISGLGPVYKCNNSHEKDSLEAHADGLHCWKCGHRQNWVTQRAIWLATSLIQSGHIFGQEL